MHCGIPCFGLLVGVRFARSWARGRVLRQNLMLVKKGKLVILQSTADRTKTEGRPRPPRAKRKRFFSIGRVLLFALLLAVVVPVAAAWIPTPRWVYGDGYLMPHRDAKLRPSVEGIAARALVDSGSQVEQGQVVIQLDDSAQEVAYEQTLSHIEVEKSRLEHLISQQEFERLVRQEQITQATLSHKLAKEYLNRLLRGGAQDLYSDYERDEGRLRADLAASRLQELQVPRDVVIEKQITVARRRQDESRKQLSLLEADRRLRQIRAPIRGIIRFHRFEPGEVVKPDDVLGQVFDQEAWVVRLKVPERFVAHVKTGQPIRVGLTAYSTVRHGYGQARVTQVEKVITPQDTGDGVFYVEGIMEPREGWEFQPGMSAWGHIDAGRTTWLMRVLGW